MLRWIGERSALRFLAKLVAVVAVGGVVGAAAGAGVSSLTATDSPGGSVLLPSGGTPAGPDGGDGARRRAQGNVRVRVISAVLHPADTPAGKRRRRARVSIHVRVVNKGRSTVNAARPALLVAGAEVRGRAIGSTTRGSLRAPVKPRTSARGRLRFETAGRITQVIVARRRASIRVARRTVEAMVKIGRPARPSAQSRRRSR